MQLRVKKILKEKGMTSLMLSEIMGVSQETISKMIGSKGNPTLDSLNKLAKALNVKAWELMEDPTGINGFIEIGDVVYKIRSKEDIENVLTKL